MALGPETDRRSLLVGTAAAGLSLGFRIPFATEARADDAPEVNAWVVVRPDDTVVIRIARAEMGQGTLTGLAQLVAEELGCDWSKVTTEFPTAGQNRARGRIWGSMSTAGSRGIRESHEYVRKGGAAARMMLIQAAANEWKVPASQCGAANGVITHAPSGRRVSFGRIASAAAKLAPPNDVKLKDPKDWTLVGKRVKCLDVPDKVTGKLVYGIDVNLAGMLSAAIRDCPVFGGKVKGFDAAAVRDMKGVKKIVQVGHSAVAVIGETWWQAKQALDKLPIVWDEGANASVSQASIDEHVQGGLTTEETFVGNQAGNVNAALASAVKTIEAIYGYPHQTHANMEPMNATAIWTADRCEVWCPTQNAEGALASVAEAADLPTDKCEVHNVSIGTGLGRRSRSDYVIQAVAIARQMPNTPVKLIWSREEDFQHGTYHPITQCRLRGGLDAEGNLTALHVRVAGQSIMSSFGRLLNGGDPLALEGFAAQGQARLGYAIPNLLVDYAMRNTHVPPGYWRGVNTNQNVLYLECFMDELAHAAGEDPFVFRRKLMANYPKHLAVLDAVAARAGWGRPAPNGAFRGLAASMGNNSYVAACAEVSLTAGGELTIHRVIAAIDPGYAVNPAQIERQIEGSIFFSLSALIYGACTVKDGRIEQSNFNDYDCLRLATMPEVESIVMPSGGFWGGVGEPVTSVAAPALLNAIFAATGRRYRTVPLKNNGITLK